MWNSLALGLTVTSNIIISTKTKKTLTYLLAQHQADRVVRPKTVTGLIPDTINLNTLDTSWLGDGNRHTPGPDRTGHRFSFWFWVVHMFTCSQAMLYLPSNPSQLIPSLTNDFCLWRAPLSQILRGPAHGQNQGAAGKGGVKKPPA